MSATIETRRLLRRRDSVLVAVSGGPDSVALLAGLVALGGGRWRIGAAHVNHGLRGADSDRDERFVTELAERLGLDVFVLAGRIVPGANLEERARELRYRLLLEAAQSGGYRRIATGHTLDDQAETFLLRLFRGAGARGLTAIAPIRADGVIRPLLDLRRADVVAFLDRRGLRHRRDRSNVDPRFTRNRIRRRLLPLLEREFNPSVRRALARTVDLLTDEDALLERMARARLAKFARADRLDTRGWSRMPVAIARRVVRLWLEHVRGDLAGTSTEHVERVVVLGRGKAGGTVSLPSGEVRRSGGRLRWIETGARRATLPKAMALAPSADRAFGGFRFRVREMPRARGPRPSVWRALFDTAAMRGPLAVRALRPGDRIRPHGLGGTKKLQDVFVDRRIERERCAGHPVVVCGDAVLWVPGVVRADAALVTAKTRRVLVIECAPPR
jgi:tRNA(Ile)-lysidine synthase